MPHRCGIGLSPEGTVTGLSHSGGVCWVSRFAYCRTSAGGPLPSAAAQPVQLCFQLLDARFCLVGAGFCGVGPD